MSGPSQPAPAVRFKNSDHSRAWRIAQERAAIDRRAREVLLPALKILDPTARLEGATLHVRRRKKDGLAYDNRTIGVDLTSGMWLDTVGGAAGHGISSLIETIYWGCPDHMVVSIGQGILDELDGNPTLTAKLNALAADRVEAAAKAGALVIGDRRRPAVEARTRALLREVSDVDLAVECARDFNMARCRPPLDDAEFEAAVEAAASAELSRGARR